MLSRKNTGQSVACAWLPCLSNRVLLVFAALFSFNREIVCFGEFDEIFDFIVVGGGTSGCTVASRLSENGKYTVLLLEAGQLPNSSMNVPALSINAAFERNAIKVFQSVPQTKAALGRKGVANYFAGKVLGGSSAVNMMLWNRGSPHDYDSFAKMVDDESWSYRNMLKYFKRVEDYQGDYTTDQHGYGGPITISRPRYAPGEELWTEAGKYLGYPVDVDQNGPQKISFTNIEYNKKFGRRVSAFEGYIMPFMGQRKNLKVIVGAHVSRILFQGNRATGVVYRINSTSTDKIHYARVRREIIVSAGVMGSPAVLMRSGIGPRKVLEESKISPVAILPVGKNLQDHVAIRLEFIVGNRSLILDEARDLNVETMKIYDSMGDGPYTVLGGTSQAFIKAPQSLGKILRDSTEPRESDQWANLHLVLLFGISYNRFFGFRPEIKMKKTEGPAIITVFLTRPKSRGTVKLNASNIEGDPLIDFQYLTHPRDIEALLYAIKMSLRIIENTPGFKKVGARYPPEPLPSCKHLVFRSDSYWRCYIRQTAASGSHGCGSSRMGKGPLDTDAVVDTELRVINMQNVRVVDLSVLPNVVNTNTQAAAFAIGEKAAEMILRSNT